MRIDSHHHFWTLARGDYGWMSPELGPIYRDFSPNDLAPLIADAGIDKTIVVQAADAIAETEFLLGIADHTDFVAGVVGWIDMANPEAIPTLERLAQNTHFKGIRPMIQDIADDEWILRQDLDRTFEALADMGLTFDALVLPRHLPHLLTRLGKHPDLKCVINHAAKPHLATGDLGSWPEDMRRIAQETSALCKLSGLVTEVGPGWRQDAIEPAGTLILEAFGAHRLMFGSDWPVLNLASDYHSWVAAAELIVNALTSQEQRAVWSGTAAEFYSIKERPIAV